MVDSTSNQGDTAEAAVEEGSSPTTLNEAPANTPEHEAAETRVKETMEEEEKKESSPERRDADSEAKEMPALVDSMDQQDDDEDDNVQDSNSSSSDKKSDLPSAQKKIAEAATDIANSKQAQILKNRFSNWRQSANESAQSFWKSSSQMQERTKALWGQNRPGNLAAQNARGVVLTQESLDGPKTPKSQEGGEAPPATPTQDAESSSTPSKFLTAKLSDMSNSGSSIGDEEDEATEGADATESESGQRPSIGVVNRAAIAASVVAESVIPTGFRGRYTSDVSEDFSEPIDPKTREAQIRENQTALILKSRAAKHMQEILDNLQPHEYAMLLGQGMWGVNLKQCYLKNHGVFVDYLVPKGQAEISGVIKTGDLPVKLNDQDIQKGTIRDIPQMVAKAKRPAAIIMASGTIVPEERISYIDIAVAMMHRAQRIYGPRTSVSFMSEDDGQTDSCDDKDNGLDVSGLTTDMEEKDPISEIDVPSESSLDVFTTPPIPPAGLRKEFVNETAQRSFDDSLEMSVLLQAVAADANFRNALRNAFLCCAMDARRLPFLTRHFSLGEGYDADGDMQDQKMSPSAQLMLFLELFAFYDLYDVTPPARVRTIAEKIAAKFFLPSSIGGDLQPPLFDFHHIVPDSSLRQLEFTLRGTKSVDGIIPKDVFHEFQKAVVESLAGEPFLSFLASPESARMRAYLRKTAPYVNIPLMDVAKEEQRHSGAKNVSAFILAYLLSRQEKEGLGEHDIFPPEGNRLAGAASGFAFCLFINREVEPIFKSYHNCSDDDRPAIVSKALSIFDKLWDFYFSPGYGTLSMLSKSNESEALCQDIRDFVMNVSLSERWNDDDASRLNGLMTEDFLRKLRMLADELLYDYATDAHTKFREHKIHEWLCGEFSKEREGDCAVTKHRLPLLPRGSLKRLLRKMEFPIGISSHKPSYEAASAVDDTPAGSEHSVNVNAQYAVVFGSSRSHDEDGLPEGSLATGSCIRRFTSQVVGPRETEGLQSQVVDLLPPTFEAYATVPATPPKCFGAESDRFGISVDGWQVSVTDFVVPNGDSSSDDSLLFGVSLVLSNNAASVVQTPPDISTEFLIDEVDESKDDFATPRKAKDKEVVFGSDGEPIDVSEFASPITFDTPKEPVGATGDEVNKSVPKRLVKIKKNLPRFISRFSGPSWHIAAQTGENQDKNEPIIIGMALVSTSNSILAMRETLSRFLLDFSRTADARAGVESLRCNALARLLGTFMHDDVENDALSILLEPYLSQVSSKWIERPVGQQAREFEKLSIAHTCNCLPPTPLALLFVAVLLEQKIVFSSSRRSILHASVTSLLAMLRPLKWTHLLVPLVPAGLTRDLIQYPAPFILGIPSEDASNMEILGSLPKDVTLVDLDVGRVILAPSFGHDSEVVRQSNNTESTIRILRSQVLYLAQSLGSVFGNCLHPATWNADRPSFDFVQGANDESTGRHTSLLACAQAFIKEIVAGTESCCYWLEEAASEGESSGSFVVDEPTVLFDEDRFFHIKTLRYSEGAKPLFGSENTNLALSLDDFDLVLEYFLRCQSLSTYVSSRPKADMMYY